MEFPEIFSRNILFWGKKKQEILQDSSILIAGMGGLGCVVSEILVRSGIGKLIIVDYDIVQESDLNRQILYDHNDIGNSKVQVARNKLAAISNHSEIIPLQMKIMESNLSKLKQFNFRGIADCLDNFESRFVLEKILQKDQFLVHGGVENDFGQITTIIPGKTQSLNEIYSNMKKRNSIIPIIPTTVQTIGSLMTQEILNNILGEPKLINEMLVVELADFKIRKIKLKKNIQSSQINSSRWTHGLYESGCA